MKRTGDLLTAFSDYQRGRGLSPETVRRRTISIGLFRRTIAPAQLESANLALVEEWLNSVRNASTRRAYRSDLSAFYTWALRRNLCKRNPVADTDSIRIPRGLPRPVDAGLVADLIRYAPDRDTQLSVALAAYAGLRRAEIAHLRRDDIALGASPPVLFVRSGKGGRDRVVPVHPALAVLLEGLPAGRVCTVQAQAIGKKVAEYLRSVGVDATLHQLRHTFATEAARVSPDLLAVRELMGHSSLQTTERYTQLTGGRTAQTVGLMFAS